jgi:hypothetical protein
LREGCLKRLQARLRWSVSGVPVTLMALNSVPTAIAAVPWMSSLKVQRQSR